MMVAPIGRSRGLFNVGSDLECLGLLRVSSEETSSPVAVPTATGKKLALPMPSTSSAEYSVSSPAADSACGSDSLCEMKGLGKIASIRY